MYEANAIAPATTADRTKPRLVERPRRALVIDDDPLTRQTVGAMLGHCGFEVEAAADGDEGLRICSTWKPDVILTDILMPEKEGLETILELRSSYPQGRIIAMSGGGSFVKSERSFLDMSKSFGAEQALAKPFRMAELASALDALTGTVAG